MEKNEVLEQICSLIGKGPANWPKMLEKFALLSPKERNLHLQGHVGKFSEFYLDTKLEDLRDEIPKLKIDLDIDFNKLTNQNEFYRLSRKGSGRLIAKRKRKMKRDAFHEYDQIAMVRDIPVNFEITLGTWENNAFKRLSPNFYSERLEVLRKFFGRDVGYIVIVSQEVYHGRNSYGPEHSKIWEDFRNARGLVNRFYKGNSGFIKEVERKLKESDCRSGKKFPRLKR